MQSPHAKKTTERPDVADMSSGKSGSRYVLNSGGAPAIRWPDLEIGINWSTSGAASNRASPGWCAVTQHLPAERMWTVEPDTVQSPDPVKKTRRPEVAEAPRLKSPSRYTLGLA
ncbi:MAG: hypothetical protein ACXVWF_07375, partial [Actinomycetota bacterium]